MAEEAKDLALPALDADEPTMVVFLESGHTGVQGIVASRLVQAYGRPALVLTPAAAPGMLTGSGRSIEGLHLRDALQRTFELVPEALPRFGGHRGAARSEEHTSELQSRPHLVCRLLLEKKT